MSRKPRPRNNKRLGVFLLSCALLLGVVYLSGKVGGAVGTVLVLVLFIGLHVVTFTLRRRRKRDERSAEARDMDEFRERLSRLTGPRKP
jgi:hypothetical protein